MINSLIKEIADDIRDEIKSIQEHYSEYILNNSVGNLFLETLEPNEDDEREFIAISFKPIDLAFDDNGEVEAAAVTEDTYSLSLWEMLSAAIKGKEGDPKDIARMVINDLYCCADSLGEEFSVDFWKKERIS